MVIEIDNLTKVYKTGFWGKKIKAIDGLNFMVKEGEIFGFLGPNGAGKTTTIKVLSGLIRPSSGKASIFDRKVPDVSIMRKVGYLPEHPSFYSHLSGFELLDFYARIFGLNSPERKKRIQSLIERVGLGQAYDLRVSKYSKGMVQRLGIAQALINNPDLLIFDEPMEGLDPIGRKDVKDIMLELKNEGKTIFFSTHILSDVEAVCDRVGIIISGHIVREGSIDDLLQKSIESFALTVYGLKEDVINRIKKATAIVRFHNSTRFIFANIDDCNETIKITQESGGGIISLIPETKTLEDYFLAAVKENQ